MRATQPGLVEDDALGGVEPEPEDRQFEKRRPGQRSDLGPAIERADLIDGLPPGQELEDRSTERQRKQRAADRSPGTGQHLGVGARLDPLRDEDIGVELPTLSIR